MAWVNWNGNILNQRIDSAINKGVKRTLDNIKAQSLQEVPHDEGWLQESIQVFMDDKKGIISAGGGGGTGFPKVPYAVKWHEKDANFQKGRKRNYVRDPLNQVGAKKLIPNISKEMRAVL